MSNPSVPTGVGEFDFRVEDQRDADGRPNVVYFPFTDGHLVGFRAEHADGRLEFIYLNPSVNERGADVPNVFVYQGPHGTPALDGATHHYLMFEEGA